MSPQTDWMAPTAILGAAIILGALLVYFFNSRRRSAATPVDRDLDRKDLEHKRDALVAQLRALPDDAIDERARLEGETAAVLRRLDGMSPLPAVRGDQGPRRSGMDPTVKGFIWGAGSTAAVAALLFFVYTKMTPRAEGGMATGGMPGEQQQQQPQPEMPTNAPAAQQAEAAVKSDPNNVQLRLQVAQFYLDRNDPNAVLRHTTAVLQLDPQNARALTFGAVARMTMGEAEVAEQMLNTAMANDPVNVDARVAAAWLYAQTNRMTEAEAKIAEATKISPQDKAQLEGVLREMKATLARQAQALPADHPPIDGAPSAPAPAGPSVRVTLQIDPAARSKTGIVFVVARPLTGGPPVAVKRMQVASFPITFDLSSADSMMGQPLPEKFRLEARLDSDGDASTKPPTDPSAMQAEVSSGAAVTLALK